MTCAVPGCDRPREDGTSYCDVHGPKEQRTSKPFSEQSGCGLAVVVLIAALLLGLIISVVRVIV